MPKPRSPEDRALIEKTLGPNDPGLPDKPFDAGPALPPPKYDPAKRPQEVRTDAGWVGTFHSPTPADAEMTDEDRKKALSWEGLKAKTKRQLEAPGPTEGDQRSALTAHFRNLGVTVVGEAQRFPTDGLAEYRIGFAGVAAEVGEALMPFSGGVEPNAIYYVGPQVGEQLRNEGVLSVIYALLGILIYIVFHFNFTFAPEAIIALVHDVLITVGIFSLFQLKFDLPIIAALLTIVGYSLNDTIVVYDQIREELGKVGEGKGLLRRRWIEPEFLYQPNDPDIRDHLDRGHSLGIRWSNHSGVQHRHDHRRSGGNILFHVCRKSHLPLLGALVGAAAGGSGLKRLGGSDLGPCVR